MDTIDARLDELRAGRHPEWRNQEDIWFAWYPVRTGALGAGRVVWLTKVWRNRCCGVTIYQTLDTLGA
jgi:hypothetical protein